jgi:hypothetical protein
VIESEHENACARQSKILCFVNRKITLFRTQERSHVKAQLQGKLYKDYLKSIKKKIKPSPQNKTFSHHNRKFHHLTLKTASPLWLPKLAFSKS